LVDQDEDEELREVRKNDEEKSRQAKSKGTPGGGEGGDYIQGNMKGVKILHMSSVSEQKKLKSNGSGGEVGAWGKKKGILKHARGNTNAEVEISYNRKKTSEKKWGFS